MEEIEGSSRPRGARRLRIFARGGLLSAAGLIVITAAASAAVLSAHSLVSGDVTSMTVSGLTGEGANGHQGSIEVASWSWGATNPHAISSSGLGGGKVTFNPFFDYEVRGRSVTATVPDVRVRRDGSDDSICCRAAVEFINGWRQPHDHIDQREGVGVLTVQWWGSAE